MLQDQQLISITQATPPFFMGIDLADAGLKVGVVDDAGRPLSWLTVLPNGENHPEDVLPRAGKAVTEAIRTAGVQPAGIARVGLALPGTVDSTSSKLIDPAGLPDGWNRLPIRERFGAYCNLPVTFANDAIAAAYGESWVGAGRKLPSLVLFTLGTRIGCGVIFGDSSIDGQGSYGVDAAHMIIHCGEDAPLCTCGQRGHLEAYIGSDAVANRIGQALARGRASTLTQRLSQGQSPTPDLLAREAEAGDALCLEIVAEIARHLAVGIVNLMNTLDPDGLLLGGAMTFGGDHTPLGRQFLQWVKEEVARRAFAALVEHTVIDFAALGSNAVCFGAAGIARADYLRSVGGV
jgi:glucokinase